VEVSTHRAADLARSYRDDQIAAVLYTDIERDGTEVGPNVGATATLAKDSGLKVIASGGVGTLVHLRQLGRASREGNGGIVGAVLGRALHERRFSLEQAIEAALS
jgi:phosphoribosylformimino-5-aminoimidazole carboxamide ribotide isomerase